MSKSSSNDYKILTYTDVWDPRDFEKNNFIGDNSYEAEQAREYLSYHNMLAMAQPLLPVSKFEISPFFGKKSNYLLEEKEYILKFIDINYIDSFCEGKVHISDMAYIREKEFEDNAQGDIYEGLGVLDAGLVSDISVTLNGKEYKQTKRSIAVPGKVEHSGSQNKKVPLKFSLLDRQGIISSIRITKNMVSEEGKLNQEFLDGIMLISKESRPFIITSRENFENSIYSSLLKYYKSEIKSVIFDDILYLKENEFQTDMKKYRELVSSNKIYKSFFRKRESYKGQHEFRVFFEPTHKSSWNNRNFRVDWLERIDKFEFKNLENIVFEFQKIERK
jgi:hypothetical protein